MNSLEVGQIRMFNQSSSSLLGKFKIVHIYDFADTIKVEFISTAYTAMYPAEMIVNDSKLFVDFDNEMDKL